MPLVERGGPQADEEVKESQEATQLLEPAPVPTEPQVRRPEAPVGRGLGGASIPSPDPSALSPQASKLLDLLDLLDGPSEDSQQPPPVDPSPEGTLIHLLDLPCAPLAPGKPQ